ncbi:MAG: zinc-dependent metalloprotease family protein [Anaeromyxobacteraceae bacterium]
MLPAPSRHLATLALVAAAVACEAERVPVRTAPPGGPDLAIATAYVVQSTQTPAFDVPLVAGKDAIARVWVTATGPATAAPLVRVSVYEGATLVGMIAVPPPGPSVPAAVDEGDLASSWNGAIPGALIQPGRSIRIDVDSDRKILETDESNNAWPPSGAPRPLDVATVPPVRMRIVPVKTPDGLTGNATATNLAYYTTLLQRAWPVATVDASLGSTFSASVSAAADGTGWSTILSEVSAKRAADGWSGYLYGAIATSYGGGVAGIGYVPGRAAIGWDKMRAGDPEGSSSSGVLAHEVGHNFGLSHAPGCSAGGPDPNYPYAGAVIGAYGLDVATGALKTPDLHDLMAYCSNNWVSDYNYRKVLGTLRAPGLAAEEPAPPAADAPRAASPASLLVWGREEGGVRTLEPAFHLPVPARPPPPGPERLTGLDAQGRALFSVPFALADATCASGPGAGFAFTVPLEAAEAAELATLRWEAAGGPAIVRAQRTPAARAGAAPSVEPASGGAVRVTWSAEPGEVAMIRDVATGEVLGFGRGGAVELVPASGALELRLPAGGAARVHALAVGGARPR